MSTGVFQTINGERVEMTDEELTEFRAGLPDEVAPAAPSVVTMRQAKIQLSRAGILGAVNDFIDGMEGQAGEEARIEWDYATELRRDHPLVAALGPQFDLSEEDIDALFAEAAEIA
jgi:hypothetical protein